MPSKHSKNSGDRGFHTYAEKSKGERGTITHRLSGDSQLPFGHCALSLTPIMEAVVSPSGRIYSREAILEYLLKKTQELKKQARDREVQQERLHREQLQREAEAESKAAKAFADNQDGVAAVVSKLPALTDSDSQYLASRKRQIDDTDDRVRIAELQAVSPWIPQFTPTAADSVIKEPPKRPPSPFSGAPLRAKDLIPVELKREEEGGPGSRARFICPVTSKTITNQKVVLIRTTGVLMLQSAAEALAYPTMTCPISGKRFRMDDVLEIVNAASGFAASGTVEAKKYRPNIN